MFSEREQCVSEAETDGETADIKVKQNEATKYGAGYILRTNRDAHPALRIMNYMAQFNLSGTNKSTLLPSEEVLN